MTTTDMTKTKACESCVFWDPKDDGKMGFCRRNAPQSIVFQVDGETRFETRFPETAAKEWCGEYTPR